MKFVNSINILPICENTEGAWPNLSSIQAIRGNLVYIVSLSCKLEYYVTLFESENELPRASRNFPNVKTRNIFWEGWGEN